MAGKRARLAVAACACAAALGAAADSRTLAIGTTVSSLTAPEADFVARTIVELSERLPQYTFQVKDYPVRLLEQAVRAGELDFFLATSGFYRRVYHRGLRDLVTLTTPEAPDPNFGSGSVFLVAKDSGICTVEDMRGKRLAISWREGFTGHFIPLGEIAARGFDPDRFFSEEVVAGPGVSNPLRAVFDGKADVAAVRACRLEEIARSDPAFAGHFQAVGARDRDTERLSCAHSTELYPNWTIVSTSRAPWQASRDVTAALLSMSETGGYWWGVVSDFTSVDDLYRTLRAGPFAYLRNRPVSYYIEAYWPVPALFLVAFGLLLWQERRVSRLVARRTEELERAMRGRELARRESMESERRLRTLEHVSVVGAMSSIFAHEINGPLAAISNMSRAIERMLEGMGDAAPPGCARAARRIAAQCEKVSEIVRRVRGYAKQRGGQRSVIDIVPIASRVFEYRRQTTTTVRMPSPALPAEPVAVLWDGLEVELCVTNLIKNAIEACPRPVDGQLRGEVRLAVTVADGHATVSVFNTAQGPDGAIEPQALESTKDSGLGIGFLIVRTLAEKAGGNVALATRGGVTEAALRVPLADGAPSSGRKGD